MDFVNNVSKNRIRDERQVYNRPEGNTDNIVPNIWNTAENKNDKSSLQKGNLYSSGRN